MSEVEGKERRKRELVGLALILIGAVLFMLQFVDGPKEAIVFFIVGGAFLVAYVQNRKYGMLVPGCILIGLGIGRVGEWANYDFGDFEHIGLGIGFILIFAIDRLTGGKGRWWPLIPGGFLLLNGAMEGSRGFDRVVSKGWPLIIVVVGVLLLTGILGRSSRRSDG